MAERPSRPRPAARSTWPAPVRHPARRPSADPGAPTPGLRAPGHRGFAGPERTEPRPSRRQRAAAYPDATPSRIPPARWPTFQPVQVDQFSTGLDNRARRSHPREAADRIDTDDLPSAGEAPRSDRPSSDPITVRRPPRRESSPPARCRRTRSARCVRLRERPVSWRSPVPSRAIATMTAFAHSSPSQRRKVMEPIRPGAVAIAASTSTPAARDRNLCRSCIREKAAATD